jgi:hypothetical protein
VSFSNEVLQHLLCNFKVRNHAILHRADRHDVSWSAAEHFFRIAADGFNCVSDFVYGYD